MADKVLDLNSFEDLLSFYKGKMPQRLAKVSPANQIMRQEAREGLENISTPTKQRLRGESAQIIKEKTKKEEE